MMHMARLRSRVVRVEQLNEGEVAAWNRLSRSGAATASPFLSYQYAAAVAAAGGNVKVCVLQRDGAVRGFFPFQFRDQVSAALKAASPVGCEMTDYFGLVADEGFRITPEELLRLSELNQVTFTHLDESQLAFGLSGEQPRGGLRVPCRQIAPGASAEQFMDAKSAKKMASRERHLADDFGPLQFSFDLEQGRAQALQDLIEQKRAQYVRTAVTDALEPAWRRTLLSNLLETRTDTCRGILSRLSAGDTWVASHFGIMGNGVLQYWLPVYNTALAKYGPGKLLLYHVYKATTAFQIHTIDRGEGVSPSKEEILSTEHQFYRGIWHNRSVPTFIARGLQSIRWRLEKQNHG